MRWAEIQVETTAQAQDAVTNIMMENDCGGTVVKGEAPVCVICYLPVDDRLEQRLLRIQNAIRDLSGFGLDVGSGEVTVKYAEEQDWAEAWKAFFRTTRVGEHIIIKPAWEEYDPKPQDVVIDIDPGMAFGTGDHPTTRLCLKELERRMKRGYLVIDFGTGSGILAIAAAKLGASLVIAFDIDAAAVRAARENVRRNDIEEVIEVHQASSLDFITAEANIVIANIVAETIIAHAESIARVLRKGGALIASGIVEERALDVEQSLRNAGFDISDTHKEGEWVAIVARKAG